MQLQALAAVEVLEKRRCGVACEAEQTAYELAVAAHAEKAEWCASLPTKPGTRKTCVRQVYIARHKMLEAELALNACLLKAPHRNVQAEGLVTFLLVVEPGLGYGGGTTNWIDADVIFKLDSRPTKAFGFRLREGEPEPIRRGMLSLLEDALIHGLKVTTSYREDQVPLNQNSFVLRVALSHPKPVEPSDTLTILG